MKQCSNKDRPSSHDTEMAKFKAKLFTDSVMLASMSSDDIISTDGGIKPDKSTLRDEIRNLVNSIKDDHSDALETTLAAQTITLDLLFNRMVTHAMSVKQYDTMQLCMDMALKVQNQCRKTILAISTLKNPQHATFVKQQNVAVNQQVNNEVAQSKSKKINSENELIGEIHHEKMDFGATNGAIGIDKAAEAMAVVDRT